MKLRYYQHNKMVTPAIKAFQSGSNYVLIVAPTGSGKSSVAAWWAKQIYDKGKRCLVLLHKSTILGQMKKTFSDFGVERGSISSGKSISDHDIQIAMVQTLANRLDKLPPFDWVIGDEAHHWDENNKWGKVVNHFKAENPNLKTLLLTATPNGMTSGRGLHPFAEVMVNDLSIPYLVSEGWLVNTHMAAGRTINKKPPKFHKKNGKWDVKEQEEYFGNKKIIGSFIDGYHQFMDGQPCLCACSTLKQAHETAEKYTQAAREKGKSWKAVMIQGGKKYEKQMFDALAGLATGSVQQVSFCNVIGEGVDVPECYGVQHLRKYDSLVLFRQINGRIMRPVWPGMFDQYNSTIEERLNIIANSIKPFARLQDYAGNWIQHGHPMSRINWTLEDTKKRKKGDVFLMPEVSVCPKCSGVWPGLPKICPDCGHNLQEDRDRAEGRKPPREIEGILREIMPNDEDIKELVKQVLILQNKSPKDRQKAMTSNIYRYGNCDRTKGMAAALGYKSNWTHVMSYRLRGRG